MNRLLSILILFCATSLFGAVGDILWVTVETNGWQALVTVSGVTTNGTYAFGVGTNNTLSSPKLTLTLTALGYDDTGAIITTPRTIYGTHQVRLPYPANASMDESLVGTNTTLRISLSDYIYIKESNVVVNVSSGLYVQGGVTNSAAVSMSCTNNSTRPYPMTVANWSWPPYERITNSTFQLRCVAFNAFARLGRPVRAVVFTATDTHSHTVTQTVNIPGVDWSMADRVPVVEYYTSMDASTLTQGDVITCNFAAYPWIGDSGSVNNSSAGASQPTPLVGPITMLNDKSGTYGQTVAQVDPVNGSDTTGKTVDLLSYNEATVLPFLTIAKAAQAIMTNNNTIYSRSNNGAGLVYLTNGNYVWGNSVRTYGNTPDTWLTVQPSPSSTRANVVITNTATTKSTGNLTKLSNVTITSATAITFDLMTSFWMDQCNINSASSSLVYQSIRCWYLTRSSIPQIAQGLTSFSTANTALSLIRSCDLNGYSTGSLNTFVYTVLGNTHTDTNTTPRFRAELTGMTAPIPIPILAYNTIYGIQGTASSSVNFFPASSTNVPVIGAVIVQNIFEASTNIGQPIITIAADTSTNTPVDNVLIWNNTVVGQRDNLAYNSNSNIPIYRREWSVKGNFFDQDNIKADVFATEAGAQGGRVGNWGELYGAGWANNGMPETTGIGSAGGFMHEFAGINTLGQNVASGSSGTTHSTNYISFVNRAAWNGVLAGAANGNYRLNNNSPLIGVQENGRLHDWVLIQDIEGNYRGARDPSGAYSSGNAPIKGVGFF